MTAPEPEGRHELLAFAKCKCGAEHDRRGTGESGNDWFARHLLVASEADRATAGEREEGKRCGTPSSHGPHPWGDLNWCPGNLVPPDDDTPDATASEPLSGEAYYVEHGWSGCDGSRWDRLTSATQDGWRAAAREAAAATRTRAEGAAAERALAVVRLVEQDMADTALQSWRAAESRGVLSDDLLMHADGLTRWSERLRMALNGEDWNEDNRSQS